MSVITLKFVSVIGSKDESRIDVERSKLTSRLPFFIIFFRKNKPLPNEENTWLVVLPYDPRAMTTIISTIMDHEDASAELLERSDLDATSVISVLHQFQANVDTIGNYARGTLIRLLKAEDKTALKQLVLTISEKNLLNPSMKKALITLTVNYLDFIHKRDAIKGIDWDISAYAFQPTPPSGLLQRTLDPPTLMLGALMDGVATGTYDDLFVKAKVETRQGESEKKIWIEWGPKITDGESSESNLPKIVHIMVWLYDFPGLPKVSAHPLGSTEMKNRTISIPFPDTCLAYLCIARF